MIQTDAKTVTNQYRETVNAIYGNAEKVAQQDSYGEPVRLVMGIDEDKKITQATSHALVALANRADMVRDFLQGRAGEEERLEGKSESDFYESVLERLKKLNSLLDSSLSLKKKEEKEKKEDKLEGKGFPINVTKKEDKEKKDRPILASAISFAAGLLSNWLVDNIGPMIESISDFVDNVRDAFNRIFDFLGMDVSLGTTSTPEDRSEEPAVNIGEPFRDTSRPADDGRRSPLGTGNRTIPARANEGGDQGLTFISRPAHDRNRTTRTGRTANLPDGTPGALGVVNELTPEAMALLDAISVPESRGEYNVIVGRGAGGGSLSPEDIEHNRRRMQELGIDGDPANPPAYFSNYREHPDIRGLRTSAGPSGAAGRYQFVRGTWESLSQRYGLRDFSPENQDRAAWHLAQEEYTRQTGRDLQSDLSGASPEKVGDISQKLSGQWSSLSGGVHASDQGNRQNFVQNYQRSLQHHERQSAVSGTLQQGYSERETLRTEAEMRGNIQPPETRRSGFFPNVGSAGRLLGAAAPISPVIGVTSSLTSGATLAASMLGGESSVSPRVAVTNQTVNSGSTRIVAPSADRPTPAYPSTNPHANSGSRYGNDYYGQGTM